MLYFNEDLEFLLFRVSSLNLLIQIELIRKTFRLISNKTGLFNIWNHRTMSPCLLAPKRLIMCYLGTVIEVKYYLLKIAPSLVLIKLFFLSRHRDICSLCFSRKSQKSKTSIARENDVDFYLWRWNTINDFRQRF